MLNSGTEIYLLIVMCVLLMLLATSSTVTDQAHDEIMIFDSYKP